MGSNATEPSIARRVADRRLLIGFIPIALAVGIQCLVTLFGRRFVRDSLATGDTTQAFQTLLAVTVAYVLLYVVGAIVVLSAHGHTQRRIAVGAALGIAAMGVLFTVVDVYRTWLM